MKSYKTVNTDWYKRICISRHCLYQRNRTYQSLSKFEGSYNFVYTKLYKQKVDTISYIRLCVFNLPGSSYSTNLGADGHSNNSGSNGAGFVSSGIRFPQGDPDGSRSGTSRSCGSGGGIPLGGTDGQGTGTGGGAVVTNWGGGFAGKCGRGHGNWDSHCIRGCLASLSGSRPSSSGCKRIPPRGN